MMLQNLNWTPSSNAKLVFAKAIGFVFATLMGITISSAQSNEPSIRWIDDFDTAVRYASSNQLPLLLHFYGDNCPPCRLLEKRAFRDPVLIDKINGQLVAARINGEKQKELRLRYQVTRWPTDVYLLPTGEEIYRSVSPQDPAAYGQMVDRVALRHRDWKAGEVAKGKANESRIANRTSTEIAQARPPGIGMNGTGLTTHPVSTSGALATKVHSQMPPANVQRTIANPYASSEPIQVPAAVNPSVPAYSPAELSSPVPATSSPVIATPIANQRPWNPNLVPPTATASQPPSISQSPTPPPAPAPTVPVSHTSHKQPAKEVRCEAVGLDGYCPISLSLGVQTKSNNNIWIEGSPRFAVKHRGRTYYCASEEMRETFLASPDQYAPYLSCFDLIHFVKTGEYVDGKCEFGCFQDGKRRVFLFHSQENCDEFKRMEAQYTEIIEGKSSERVAGQSNGQQIR